jgi:uncharacterized protein Yka (UPF0111/DUF47 family)
MTKVSLIRGKVLVNSLHTELYLPITRDDVLYLLNIIDALRDELEKQSKPGP